MPTRPGEVPTGVRMLAAQMGAPSEFAELHRCRRFVVRSTVRNGTRVVVKRPIDAEGQALLGREEEMLRLLDVPGVVRLLGTEEAAGATSLILEDAGPESLQQRIDAGPLQTGDFLALASALAETAARIHARRIVHGAITPGRIRLGPELRPTLVHFSDASRFGELPSASAELDLTWAAPEQTGHMHRPLDGRTDLYALGATFYAMLTGSPPFRSADPLELAHAHLAQVPALASVANPNVPPGLAAIVQKLLEKAPEQRYQSAEALLQDLREAAQRWTATGTVEPFELGRGDLAYRLPLPHLLYGREAERAFLERAFDEATRDGSRFVLVEGEPGVGKTSLVDSLADVVLRRGGRFVSGKALLRASTAPHASVAKALRDLVRSLSAASDAERERVVAALRETDALLVELVPELAELGIEPKRVDLGPVEAQFLLHREISILVRSSVSEEHPLVLFLDDLQWADDASLLALQTLATEPGIKHVLLVGGLRPREASPALERMLAAVGNLGVSIQRCELFPLEEGSVVSLLADALHSDRERVRGLARLLTAKTSGNPFFLRQLLRSLQKEGLLVWNEGAARWTWDLRRIEGVGITQNVAALMAGAIRDLPVPTREVLRVAACAGTRTPRFVLERSLALSPMQVDERLHELVGEGLLLREGAENVVFAHDRIEQAAYESMSEAERRRIHRLIGRLLLETGGEEAFFRAVDQLNLGAEPTESREARFERALLNQRAGARARAATAYGAAFAYLQTALELIGPSAPQVFQFALRRDAADAAFLSGNLERCLALVDEGLQYATAVEERAGLHALRIRATFAAGRHAESLAIGRNALSHLFGLEIPADLRAATDAARQRIDRLLAGRQPESLASEPFVEDPRDQAFLDMMSEMFAPAWFFDHDLLCYLSAVTVEQCLERGFSPSAVVGIACYPFYLFGVDAAAMGGFARLAVRIGERSSNRVPEVAARYLECADLLPWEAPYAVTLSSLRQVRRLAIECGDLREATLTWMASSMYNFLSGMELERILAEIDEGVSFCNRLGFPGIATFQLHYRWLIRELQGLAREPGSSGDEEAAEAAAVAALGPSIEAHALVLRLWGAVVFRNHEEAKRLLAPMRRMLPLLQAIGPYSEGTFMDALTELADARGAVPPQASAARERMREWEEGAPDNYRPRRLLLDAEIARVEGRNDDAAACYDEAIDAARAAGLVQDAALASEWAGRHYFTMGRRRLAAPYLAEARESWGRWGATGKVRALEKEFGLAPGLELSRGASIAPVAGLDALSLLRTAQSISSEVRLSRLLPKLVQVCIQAAGAERGVLVLEQDGSARVRASGDANGTTRDEDTPLGGAAGVCAAVVEAVRSRRIAVLVDDAASDPRYGSDADLLARKVKSILAIPIRRQEEFLGVFYFENSLTTGAFTRERVLALELLSGEIAIALENGRLFEALESEIGERRKAEEAIRFLADASAVLAQSLDYDATLQRLAQLAVPRLAEWSVIFLVDESGRAERGYGAHRDPAREPLLAALRERYPPPLGISYPAGQVLASGTPVLVPVVDDARLDAVVIDREHARLLRGLGLRSVLAVPLVARGRTLGVMSLYSPTDWRYGPADLPLAEELARRAALAIDNARLYREAQEAIRVREEFLSVASHELKTPITSMTTAIGSALRKGLSEEAVGRTFATTQRGLRRLNHLVDQLLEVSEAQSGELELEREAFDLAEAARAAVARAEERIATSGSLVEVIAPAPIRGSWDRRRIEEVVASLLDNALKFGAGKPVRVTVEAEGESARLTVHDEGIGIPPERLPHVFERFERAVSSQHYGGWGLGLYLVRRVVEAHGGSVAAESTAGGGTTFTVTLPLGT
ncbi:GAF domain-containing protein [Vulgatibacter sp.]|uniref:GAF domain-containing protein n=1 Tax=Vulgatibacter sp. TaxID=1971226 RepID=UPI003563C85E